MFPSDAGYDAKVMLETERMPLADDLPFHILLLGDWSGERTDRSKYLVSERRPIEIDRDNFDDVLSKLNVKLDLNFQGDNENVLSLRFAELEDFHPDRIFQRLALFADLRDIRRRLINAATFDEAAREVRSWYIEEDGKETSEDKDQIISNSDENNSQDGLLDRILFQADETALENKSQNIDSSVVSAFVRKIVEPHLIQIDTSEQSNLLIIVDEVISDLMRKILHHPRFQALESAWRGAYFLVRRIESGTDLKIYLLDINKNELAGDLKNVNNLKDSLFFQIFDGENSQIGFGKPWAVVCGNYTFSLNVEDVAALTRIAKIADSFNAPFISHITPELFGFKSFGKITDSTNWKIAEDSTENKLWSLLRAMPESTHLALAIPRVLARLPYGNKTEPTETFSFEEFTLGIEHEQYLWCNPVFINALLLGQTFREYGWNISTNFVQDISDLPLYVYRDEYEDKTKPCAEILMTQSICEKILEQGLTPVISFKDIDRVRIARLQSIAYPFTFLNGKWS